MKAELEPKEIQYQGVSIISETEEEKQILLNLWNQKARPAILGRLSNGQVEIIFVPTPEEVSL